jgi:hypothetical protein
MDCVLGSICFEMAKGVPAAFVTLIIGTIAGLITFRQYQVARAKLKLDLFEKRITVFNKTWQDVVDTVMTRDIIGTNYTEEDDFPTPFSNYRPEAAFLFGKDIDAYMNELSSNWSELHNLEHPTVDADQERPDADGKRLEKLGVLMDWFVDQASTRTKAKFSPYLDFANWK